MFIWYNQMQLSNLCKNGMVWKLLFNFCVTWMVKQWLQNTVEHQRQWAMLKASIETKNLHGILFVS